MVAIRETDAAGPLLDLPGAVAAPLPEHVEPALATPAAGPPSGEDWVHEIKLDGYRILAKVDRGRVTLSSRRGNDWTDRVPELAGALAALADRTAILDGELVALDARGVSDFQRLQDALGRARVRRPLVYFAFDLLYLDGVDLRAVGLVRRKALLGQVLASALPPLGSTVRLSEHVTGQGPACLAQAARLGLEGIVSKQKDAPYRPGRGPAWLKVKCAHRQEFVVVGFTDPKGSRSHLGALLLATQAGDGLVYRGRVGTGLGEASLRELARRLAALRDGQPRLAHAPSGAEARGVHWVRPQLVVEVSFAGLTEDGLLRHATFRGRREDKAASEVVLEAAGPVARPTR